MRGGAFGPSAGHFREKIGPSSRVKFGFYSGLLQVVVRQGDGRQDFLKNRGGLVGGAEEFLCGKGSLARVEPVLLATRAPAHTKGAEGLDGSSQRTERAPSGGAACEMRESAPHSAQRTAFSKMSYRGSLSYAGRSATPG